MTQPQKPLVSIICLFYNLENFVEACVRSCLEQTYPNIEIICVDNGSSDSTLTLLQDLASKYTNVRLVEHKEGLAVAAARLSGINASKGELISIIDGDDQIHRQYVEVLAKILEDESVEMSQCNFGPVDRKTDFAALKHATYAESDWRANSLYTNSGQEVLDSLFKINPLENTVFFSLWAKLLRRTYLEQHGLLAPEKWLRIEEAPICSEVFAPANKLAYVDLPLYFYVSRNSSFTKSFSPRDIAWYSEDCAQLVNFLETTPDVHIPPDAVYAWYWNQWFSGYCNKAVDTQGLKSYETLKNIQAVMRKMGAEHFRANPFLNAKRSLQCAVILHCPWLLIPLRWSVTLRKPRAKQILDNGFDSAPSA